ncbi:FxLYD domain-containing protein [Evansella cellulosilytica]|uniref:DUF4878 domain-containing protein n=1 Tax=Evansella cellulosilytica (strain ATCC 21833 / DSM 2522 / FERM P-1141 / JCM 9156 / N-4) TaxID=649639 RepID=E6TX85_EVAC2|nr:FxLYD domain-containing protein [Evansella cellulosilytica]ADU32280.1 hypothetical protein Bcell_4050 [Evansella cellulosilytica DSM 2522]
MKKMILVVSIIALFFLAACSPEEEAVAVEPDEVEETEEIEEQEEELTEEERILEVIRLNIEAANKKDVDLYLSTIHPELEGFDTQEEELTQFFQENDIKYTAEEVEVIEIGEDEAKVEIVQLNEFALEADTRAVAIYTMRKYEGEWKIAETEVVDVTYVNEALADGHDFGGGLILTHHEYIYDDFNEYVIGSVVNESNNSYSLVQVDITLTDEDGNVVGSTFDMITDFAAGQTWNFEALVFDENVAYYEIIDIYGLDYDDANYGDVSEGLTLVDHDSRSDEWSSYVVGSILNESNETFDYVQVSVNLFDVNGNLVGSTLDNVNNLRSGETWNFEAIILNSNVDSYEIVDIFGW